MKKIATLLILLSAATVQYAQTVSTDSIPPVPAVTTYPTLQPISPYADLNTAVMALKFTEASEQAKKQITAAKRKKESTEALEEVVSICNFGESGLRGVDKVIIVDSIVVNKKNFLSAYPLSSELGKLTLSEKGDIVQYQTQINGMILKPEISTEHDNHLQLMRYYLEGDQLTEKELIEGLGIDGDINYPFLMPDGQMFYFAARSDDGYGNYDLYATRYDTDTQRFYHAENMGYPYNSYANDYMLVIDETNNLGWFASDRYQPTDKVCIYTFIPNTSRHTIDYENTNLTELRNAASLRSIANLALTDEQNQAAMNARKRAQGLRKTAASIQTNEFEFIINDAKTYYRLSDFTSPEAKKQCSEWLQKSKNLSALQEQLQQLRDQSPSAVQQILNLEKRVVELQSDVHTLAKKIRSLELSKK